MGSMMNLLRGTVFLTVSGPFPERLLNLCARRNLTFWGLTWQDEHTLSLHIRRGSLAELEELADRAGCDLSVRGRRGLPFFLGRFQRRYAFLAGLALSVVAVSVLSGFVLRVEVTGNQRLTTAEILTELRRLGVRPGVYGPALERTRIAQQALLELEELSFLTINLHGTLVQVVVREAVLPPPVEEEGGVTDIISTADGIITRIEAAAGEAVVAEGATVSQGDLLIRGNVELKPPKYSELPSRWMPVRARGVVEARTWRTLTAAIPLTAQVKDFTGEEKTGWSLTLFGGRVDFFGNSSIFQSNYDKITTLRQWTLPGGFLLPICLEQTRFRAYETRAVEVDQEAARALLEERLLRALEEMVGENGQVLATVFSARIADGLFHVKLTAECRESIGREQPGVPMIPQADAWLPIP